MNLHGFAGNAPIHRALAGSPPHAVIISGPEGSGRHTLALRIAQAHVCSAHGERPCLACADCRLVALGVHPDVQNISAFSAAQSGDVRVGDVRALRADAQVRPNQAAGKVYIIDRPLNPAAQNALLKLLEEGPRYAAFILVTSRAEELLGTVRSRCARYQTAPVSQEEMIRFLREHDPERSQNDLQKAADQANGLIGKALALLEGEKGSSADPAVVDAWEQALLRRSEPLLMEQAVAVQTGRLSRETAQNLFSAFAERLHAALLSPQSPLAQSYSSRQLLQMYESARQALMQCQSNVAPAHTAAWLAVRLWESAWMAP